jgi:hypothetical protein
MTPRWKQGLTAGLALLLGVLLWNELRVDLALAADAPGPGFWVGRVQVWIAAIATLAVYSFLIRDNFLYQAFEHAFMGVAMGMGVVIVIQDVLASKWWVPMALGFRRLAAEGPSPEAWAGAALVIPGVIGLLWYFQFTKRYLWLSRIPLCIGLGVGAGMGFKNIFNTMMPQITGTFKPLWVGPRIVRDATSLERAAMSFENLVFVVGTLSVLSYFFFAFGRRKLGLRAPARLGRWYLMLSLGAFFGNTFMSRLSALIERFQFLFTEWLRLAAV